MDSTRTTGEWPTAGERYCFGAITVDATAHTVSRDGRLQAVEPKAFAVLLVLLRHAGELVSRDQLLDAVWGHRHVTPGVLTRAIAQLRHTLDDDPHEPRYIQTQHALGYRFVGELKAGVGDAHGPEAAAPLETSHGPGHPSTTGPPIGAILGHWGSDDPVGGVNGQAGHPVPHRRVDDTPHRRADDEPHVLAAPESNPDPANEASPRQRPRLRGRGRLRGWGVAAGVLAIALAILAWLYSTSVPVRAEEASVAVLPFTNLSNDRDDRYFAEGLAVEMHDTLAGVRGLKVAAHRAAGQEGKGDVDVKALGKTLGVASVLDASVRRDGSRVRINARLSDTRTGYTLWSESYEREAADVFALQSEIANEVVRALLGVLPADRPALTKRLAPTQNVTAYDAYLKGVRQLQEPGSEENLNLAISFFRQALSSDARFARAQAGICRAEIRRFESARDTPAFQRAQSACKRASEMDAGAREVSLAFGEMHRVRGAYSEAIAHYTKALDDVAMRPSAYIGLARTQGALGNSQLAFDYFQRAHDLRPGDSLMYSELGYHQYLTGDLPKAIESYRTATTLQPDDAKLWSSLGGLYLSNGDAAQAAEAFMRSLDIKPSYGALSNLGTLRYNEGAYAEAASLFRRATELEPDDYRVWGNVGDALAAMPEMDAQTRTAYERAARMAEGYVRINTGDAQALALLGWYQANLGDGAAARGSLERAESLGTERGEIAFLAAQTFAVLGDTAGAREKLRRAREEGIPQQRIQASPVLRALDTAVPAPPKQTKSDVSQARSPRA